MTKTTSQFIVIAAAVIFSGNISAQNRPPAPKLPPVPPVTVRVAPQVFERKTTERSADVDPNVSIKLCVAEGRLDVNGWDRNEVRVFIRNGADVGIKVLERSAEGPNWIVIERVVDPKFVPRGIASECLSGENIELDVPMSASIEIKGRSTESRVDSVKRINIKTIEGAIQLRNIRGGVEASTYQGDVTVENSGGAIALDSATGNILAFEVSSGDVGDVFRAKTNSGAISLQKVKHRQIESSSITGSVFFDGRFMNGGIYNFRTSNGSVRLTLPPETSCKVIASYGFGSFDTDIPVTVLTENDTAGGRNFVADMGSGELCSVSLTTISGSITIKEQPEPDQ